MYGHRGGRRYKYVSMVVPIECMGTAVEGVLSIEEREVPIEWRGTAVEGILRGSYRMYGHSGGESFEYVSTRVPIDWMGGRSSEYISTEIPIECMGTAVEMSSEYVSMGFPIEYIGRTVEGVNLCPCREQKQGRPGWLPQSPY